MTVPVREREREEVKEKDLTTYWMQKLFIYFYYFYCMVTD